MRWRRATLMVGLVTSVAVLALVAVEVARGGRAADILRLLTGGAIFAALCSVAFAARWAQIDRRQRRRNDR